MNISVICTIAGLVWREMLRRKDIYVLLILLAALLFSLLSVDIFGLKGVAAYVKDLGLSFTWLFAWILAVLVGARQLPAEERQGTIFTLLSKPITRAELVVGKWLGAWSITSAATLCFYALIMVVVAVPEVFSATSGGLTGAGEALRRNSFQPWLLLQATLLHAAALAVICAIALALSTRMNFDAAATFCFVLTAASLLVLPRIPELLLKLAGLHAAAMTVLWYLMPHFEVFDLRQRLIYDGIPARWTIVGLSLAYGMTMTALILLMAWLGYRNKKFRRGDVA